MQRPHLRDVLLFAAALAFGWWVRGVNAPVQAQHAAGNLSYQFTGLGHDVVLSVYNQESQTIYVYPTGIGNSHINCEYSLRITKPGGPLERQNCSIGSLY